ncbi:MAG: cell division protein ZipA [Gammaproteobacteria bacterium]|nr:cell division protein ZipA [Gammaproteobacteria bacterium]
MMDNLRWILLGVGIVLIVGVYFWGRSRKKNNFSSPLDAANDVPSFSAAEDEGWKDGVGPVRVVAADKSDNAVDEIEPWSSEESGYSEINEPVEDTESMLADEIETETVADFDDSEQQQELAEQVAENTPQVAVDDVVALYIVAQHGQQLKGEQVLSATVATQLEYGEMKIFHRMDSNGKIIFSMSNMLEPGWFEVDKMHEMQTRGISLFIQLRLCDDPVKALDDMLICAHTMANMLAAQLCDQNRQLLNESYTKALRAKAKLFAEEKNQLV